MKLHGERMAWHRVLCVLLLCLVVAAPVPAGEENDVAIMTPRVVLMADEFSYKFNWKEKGRMSGTELAKLIEEGLGKGNYQQVTVILNTCHSGAGLEPITAELTGASTVISACGSGQRTTQYPDEKTGETAGFISSFFDSVQSKPNESINHHFDEGKKGTPRCPRDEKDEATRKEKYEQAQKWRPEVNKQRTQQGKKPLALLPDWDQGGRDIMLQEPQKRHGRDAVGGGKLAAGTKSNHAIIYHTSGQEGDKGVLDKAKAALKAAGFDSIHELTPWTADDTRQMEKIKEAYEEAYTSPDPLPSLPKPRVDLATPDNLKKLLASLKKMMNQDEHLLILVDAHGGESALSDASTWESDEPTDLPSDEGPEVHSLGLAGGATSVASAPLSPWDGDGRRCFSNAYPNDHTGDHSTGSLVAEEALDSSGQVLLDDWFCCRWEQPALVIQTAAEWSVSGSSVTVLVNGLALGELVLDPNGVGFHYLSFSDSFVEGLVNTTDFTHGFDIEFVFADPRDGFTLATPDDLIAMDGGLGYYGMSIVCYLDGDDLPDTDEATIPIPLDGASEVQTDLSGGVTVSWWPARSAVAHDLYIGEDYDDVNSADASTPGDEYVGRLYASHYRFVETSALSLGETYYWRVDEVNEADTPPTRKGQVWTFTLAPYVTVDDFESYTNDSPNQVFQTWVDGVGFDPDAFFPGGHPGNGTGATIGHAWGAGTMYTSFMETAIVHRGAQSMPLYYFNLFGTETSLAERRFDPPEDWTRYDAMSFCIHGDPNNSGQQFFVGINDQKVYPDVDLKESEWQTVTLSAHSWGASTPWSHVDDLGIGVDGADAAGIIYIDDIRLIPKP